MRWNWFQSKWIGLELFNCLKSWRLKKEANNWLTLLEDSWNLRTQKKTTTTAEIPLVDACDVRQLFAHHFFSFERINILNIHRFRQINDSERLVRLFQKLLPVGMNFVLFMSSSHTYLHPLTISQSPLMA